MAAATMLFATHTIAAPKEVAIRVSPSYSMQPASVSIQIDVERNPANRLLRVTADSGDFYWSSERQIEGEGGPKNFQMICRDLPAGEYDIRAQVIGPDAHTRASAWSRIRVFP